MKRVKSFVAMILVLCTVFGMFSMLAPVASAATVKVSISDIMVGGKKFADYIEKNKKMPGSVNCNGTSVTCQQFLYLANGKDRTLDKPKRKKRKHVQKVLRSETRVVEKIIHGDKVLNSELRRDLAFHAKEMQANNLGG